VSEFRFVVEGSPPSINRTYKIVYMHPFCHSCGRGRATLAKASEVATWQDQVAWLAKAARPSGWMPARRVRIIMDVYVKNERQDADGPSKALQDSVAHGLGFDDRICLLTTRRKEVDKLRPRIEVSIENETD
jgi:Holliday junction resolvase RusA-like endonuclease